MPYLGPFCLGVLARATDDPATFEVALAEAEALLAAGAVSHNHLLFRNEAIDACLATGAWDQAEHHAEALAAYGRREPSAWTDFVVESGRLLAAAGRSGANPYLTAQLRRLRDQVEVLGLLIKLSTIDTALLGSRA
jgi:hypothetical protein